MSHISQQRLLTQAEYDTLEMVVQLRKTRGVSEPEALTQRDIYIGMAAGFIMAAEEADGDDNEQHGWGAKT